MNFQKLIAGAFAILFIVILYIIIYYALKIMNKDIRGGNRRRGASKKGQKSYGIEVESSGDNPNLKQGTLIHIRDTVSIGRRDDNSIILTDSFVSGHHAKLFIRNNNFYVEDLGSTNGTFINGSRIDGSAKLNVNDELKIGSVVFRVI
ncbi:FHA domain-containing protein [Clostridium sp. 'White wine YQ']|uniref:FHA domain-containing protein n=1 Tax=Clostridium sp. 'White wine YQ' TaxID=3027474 RepID=UPI002366A78F|nr:FHA domain-containing protein [Clostridium sp. 'White wine YQ']MDD7795645.1 FHA domain-containing protein [Clostridium sp. 'White wine YQ']